MAKKGRCRSRGKPNRRLTCSRKCREGG